MMSQTKVQAIPNGMHTVTPHLVCENAADAIAFYIKAFNAVELSRLPGPEGKIMQAQKPHGDYNAASAIPTSCWSMKCVAVAHSGQRH
jgi:hypothetical protein